MPKCFPPHKQGDFCYLCRARERTEELVYQVTGNRFPQSTLEPFNPLKEVESQKKVDPPPKGRKPKKMESQRKKQTLAESFAEWMKRYVNPKEKPYITDRNVHSFILEWKKDIKLDMSDWKRGQFIPLRDYMRMLEENKSK